ncbi:MAG: winged helix-turn-helix transcriptional regulator [Planctomycetes bacterium]|nr:winged helix-turn-helix transcriptional regulator [Planctomycetota bacterium]
MRERAPSAGKRTNESVPGLATRADAASPRDVASMVEDVIGCKWSLRLLQLIADGVERPSAFQRACSGLSAKVMNERLAKLLRFGIASRSVEGTKPPLRVTYTLTPFGRRFVGVLDEVRRLQALLDEERASSATEVHGSSGAARRRTTS